MITAEYTIPGLRVIEHEVAVPLRWWDDSNTESITVFAREVVDTTRVADDLPYLVFLQGGPGGKGPRPLAADGWIGEALKSYRVVLLDQRGTGRSSNILGRTMERFDSAKAGADYLRCFRADSIVADAEHLRKTVFGGKPWSTLGQSYGGFLTLTYLSQAPEGLRACYVTGGLASVTPDAAEVYRRTFPRTEAKNREFYARFPHDEAQLARIADRLSAGDVYLPDGDLLTVRRLQTIGIDFGMKPGFERVHWLIDEAFVGSHGDELSDTFLAQVNNLTSHASAPLFAALQESIYGNEGAGATGWAAQREIERRPQFAESARPLLLTGEMMFPWMFDEIRALKPFQPAVEYLSSVTDWSRLYDLDVLAQNEVPVAAAVYFDDMYVDSGLQLDTAAAVGNTHAWVTNEFEHDGIGSPTVFPYLRNYVTSRGGDTSNNGSTGGN